MTDDVPVGRSLDYLRGVRVVDMTRALAGPFCGMMLADLGAEVVKLEPTGGDPTRTHPPYEYGGDGGYFLAVNRNKKSIAVDLKTPEGHEVFERLMATTDVLVDNLRYEHRKAIGVDFESLERLNPAIVSCSITGFGSDGPYRDRPAYDIIVEAMAGVMSLTGPEGGPSVRAGVPIGDLVAGMYGVIGALAGLERRRATGKGSHVDVSMLDCQISLLSYLAQYHFLGGMVASHQGRGHVGNPMYNAFETADTNAATGLKNEIVMNAGNDDKFAATCRVLGRPELADDPRFLHRKERLANRDALEAVIQSEIQKWTAKELYEALVEAEVPVAPINSIDGALTDPQVRHREMVVKVPHRDGGEYLALGAPVKSEDAVGEVFLSPPAIGGQTADLMVELGYSADEVAALADRGIVVVGGGA